MTETFFPYRFDRRLALMWVPFGARPGRDGVTVTDEVVRATFGWLKLETPRSNVLRGHITGPYRWHTAVGARLSFVDDGLTFGTNRDRGVCLHFDERVPAVLGSKRHSALTVTVADCDGLVATVGEVT